MQSDLQFYSGTSGLVLPVPNKTHYPEQYKDKSRLTYYASLFNSIEINSSFYKLPRKATVTKWADSVHQHFRFSYKLWKEVTHKKNLEFSEDDIYAFMESVSDLDGKQGCLLVQFPGKISIDNLESINEILNCIGIANDSPAWPVQVEFRNTSLYNAEVYSLLRDHNAGLVVHDSVKSPTPLHKVEAETIYLRFHGPEDAFRGSYSDEHLEKYAKLISRWVAQKKTVYTYFNNTLGAAVQDLMRLNEFVRQGKQ